MTPTEAIDDMMRASYRRLTDASKSAANESAADQIARLAEFIMAEIDGEPSQSEGAIDTAIRLLRTPHKIDAEVIARVQVAMEWQAPEDSREYYVTLFIADVKAMLEALL